jgi:hypothetical protein
MSKRRREREVVAGTCEDASEDARENATERKITRRWCRKQNDVIRTSDVTSCSIIERAKPQLARVNVVQRGCATGADGAPDASNAQLNMYLI